MLTARQRNAVLKRLYDYFNSAGRVMTEQEYRESDAPVRYLAIVKGFRTYKSAITMLKKKYPKWDLAQPAIIEEPKPVKVERVDPLAALSSKASERVEIEDEDE